MPLLLVADQPAAGETGQPLDPVAVVTRGPIYTVNPTLAMRTDAAYQGIIDSLPTLLKESMPPTITDDNLDGFATYFSIPPSIIETRLALPSDQVILCHIDAGSTNPDFTPGYTTVYMEDFTYVNSILKRIVENIPASTSHPSKRTKRSVPKKLSPQALVYNSEESAAHSQGSAHMGPVAPPVTLPAATVDLTSSATLSNPSMGHYGDQESLKFLRRSFARERAKRSCFLGTMANTWRPLIRFLSWKSPMKLHRMLANPLSSCEAFILQKDSCPVSTLKGSLRYLGPIFEALYLAIKAWADERAALIAEGDDSRARYGELEQASAVDNRSATEALEQAIKERDAVLASVASARVQFTNYKKREFLNSPYYASKVNCECTAYFTTLALDYKDRFPDLVTLFDEEKASKADWYRDFSLDEEDSSDEEEAEGAEVPTVAAESSEPPTEEANPLADP
ncbi:hypothetical protein LIER_17361 [Lithospermum erythrorhizon]|uniref:Uncharacterized protein n=1 Tax=Lithospermum erythrorhizon TaxID=34254 RepID=A0AAV3QBN3_LITER